ncbi:MAG: bifunctional phosphoribosyl-AMP cyclohydrolase/phosphoribosyl-ATP diphosphatase HisIE [Lachnospiraceae bacterium]|nr:bifunctional phosphoribosyl-AMP cyclohydrolase/phosphoribosyl-ATP diphosphatase HisIE [Lachnospiraceae bacterium]
MNHKNIVATMFLKDGTAVRSIRDFTKVGEWKELAKLYSDSGVDKIYVFDLSETDEEHEKNLHIIKEIFRVVEIPLCAGGNINRMEDIKKYIYAGCKQVMLNGSKSVSVSLAEEGSKRFGKDRILISVENVDFLFKNQEVLDQYFHEMLVLDPDCIESVESITNIPFVVKYDSYDEEQLVQTLKRANVRGICGPFIDDPETDIMSMKLRFSQFDIRMDHFAPELKWSSLKTNSDGLIPVIVQDYKNAEVLMLAYMNEEAFHATIATGRMHYYSRSRQSLWEKGETSGHFQYVKSLIADCDFDTILAKVSQIEAACHTGARSCFFNDIVKKQYVDKNPLQVFEDEYRVITDRKEHPKEGSYTNYLFDKGIDKILKKVGEEATEIVIAAKNPEPQEIVYEISDFLYHMMVLMVERGVTWEDVVEELAQR